MHYVLRSVLNIFCWITFILGLAVLNQTWNYKTNYFVRANRTKKILKKWEKNRKNWKSGKLTDWFPFQLIKSLYLGVLRSSRINCQSWTWRLPGAESDFIAHSGTFGDTRGKKHLVECRLNQLEFWPFFRVFDNFPSKKYI